MTGSAGKRRDLCSYETRTKHSAVLIIRRINRSDMQGCCVNASFSNYGYHGYGEGRGNVFGFFEHAVEERTRVCRSGSEERVRERNKDTPWESILQTAWHHESGISARMELKTTASAVCVCPAACTALPRVAAASNIMTPSVCFMLFREKRACEARRCTDEIARFPISHSETPVTD